MNRILPRGSLGMQKLKSAKSTIEKYKLATQTRINQLYIFDYEQFKKENK
jgi:hypothetical protein